MSGALVKTVKKTIRASKLHLLEKIPIESGGFCDGGGFVSPYRGILDEKGPTGVVTSARQ